MLTKFNPFRLLHTNLLKNQYQRHIAIIVAFKYYTHCISRSKHIQFVDPSTALGISSFGGSDVGEYWTIFAEKRGFCLFYRRFRIKCIIDN
jgi:hypothetical protein